MATVYLGLGSNLGERAANLRAALRLLGTQVTLERVSRLYETEPAEGAPPPLFLNAVCRGTTSLEPQGLLCFTQEIEAALGRVRSQPLAPRPIDIDILFYDDLVVESAELVLPHPRLHQRAFVLVPLAELAPELRHPTLGKTVTELLAALGSASGVKRLEEQWCQLPAIRRAR